MNEELKTAGDVAKDPASYTWVTYAWVILLSCWGGVVRYVNQMRKRKRTWRQIAGDLTIECIRSAFPGIITFYLCEYAGLKPLFTAAMVAISGHMGARAIYIIEDIYRSRVGLPPREPDSLSGNVPRDPTEHSSFMFASSNKEGQQDGSGGQNQP